jgi:hypothetical protein
LGLRSWGHGTHGGTRATPSQEARAGATGGVAVPELFVPDVIDTWAGVSALF